MNGSFTSLEVHVGRKFSTSLNSEIKVPTGCPSFPFMPAIPGYPGAP